MTFNELMQKYVNTDYETLVKIAQEGAARVLPACQKVDTENNGCLMFTAIILSAIAADGVLTKLEKQMLRDVLGMDDSTIQKLISMYDSNMPALVDHFADNMGTDLKADTLLLVTAFAAVDEKISREETALIRKLIES